MRAPAGVANAKPCAARLRAVASVLFVAFSSLGAYAAPVGAAAVPLPSVAMPRIAPSVDRVATATNMFATVDYSATSPVGIAQYAVSRQIDGGPFQPLALVSPLATSVVMSSALRLDLSRRGQGRGPPRSLEHTSVQRSVHAFAPCRRRPRDRVHGQLVERGGLVRGRRAPGDDEPEVQQRDDHCRRGRLRVDLVTRARVDRGLCRRRRGCDADRRAPHPERTARGCGVRRDVSHHSRAPRAGHRLSRRAGRRRRLRDHDAEPADRSRAAGDRRRHSALPRCRRDVLGSERRWTRAHGRRDCNRAADADARPARFDPHRAPLRPRSGGRLHGHRAGDERGRHERVECRRGGARQRPRVARRQPDGRRLGWPLRQRGRTDRRRAVGARSERARPARAP